MVHELGVVQVKSESKRYSCKACGATFNSAEKLQAHSARAHAPQPTNMDTFRWVGPDAAGPAAGDGIVCDACGCVFDSPGELQVHLQWLAPQDRSLCCPGCHQVLADARALEQHQRVSGCSAQPRVQQVGASG